MTCKHCESPDTYKSGEWDFGVNKVVEYQCHKCGKTFREIEK